MILQKHASECGRKPHAFHVCTLKTRHKNHEKTNLQDRSWTRHLVLYSCFQCVKMLLVDLPNAMDSGYLRGTIVRYFPRRSTPVLAFFME